MVAPMRLRPATVIASCLAVLATGLPAVQAAEPASQADALMPRATASGTPAEILRTIPASAPLRVGYKRGSFPVVNPVKKDRRGCTLRNQLLIKSAVKRPKVGAGCTLTGGQWSLDFGTRTETNPAKVRVTRLVPDVYVYGQGAYLWTPAQRAAYSTYIAPTRSTRVGYRNSTPAMNSSSYVTTSLTGDAFLKRIYTTLVTTSTPTEADLNALKAQNPRLFEGWTLATLLNAKAWGISFSPTVYANFQVTIRDCSEDPAKDNPCSQSYTVPVPVTTNEAGKSETQQIAPMTVEMSSVAPVVPEIFRGYNQPKTGDVVSRHLFGIHAPANWFSHQATNADEKDVDGPIDPDTVPSVPVGYVRMWDTETTWKDLEPAKGQFNWYKLSKQIQVAQQRDAKVMLVLGGTPGWAGGSPTSPPNSIDDWRSYVGSVCRQFGASIHAYEVWNEANLQTFWTGSAAQLADLTKAAFEEIRKCNPGALVVAANTTSRADGSFANFFPAYLQELKARGWPADGYSLHSYPKAAGGNGDRIAGIAQFRTMLALAGAPFTAVFDTEANYGMAGLGQGKVEIVGEPAAALMSRTYIVSVRYGFGSTFWFVWTKNPDSKMGIQFTPQATAEKTAWNKTYDWLVGAQFHACGEHDQYRGLVVCQFDRNGSDFSLAWFGEVNQGSSTTLAPGTFNGLGSECDSLLGGSCKAILEGTAPITSTPIRIYGPTLATADTPEAIRLRPQTLPTLNTSDTEGVPVTIVVTNAQGKHLAGERVKVAAEGAITADGSRGGAIEVTTGADGMARVVLRGIYAGQGRITLTAVRKPDLVVTADATVKETRRLVLESVARGVDAPGTVVVIGYAPLGLPAGTKVKVIFAQAWPNATTTMTSMGGGRYAWRSVGMPRVARVVSNRLTVPAMGQTANR